MSQTTPIILAGYLNVEITDSTLGVTYPGDKQRISFAKRLDNKIVNMLLTSDIYALLGSYKDTNQEMVKLLKESFNSTTNSVSIIRGISKFASNEYADNTILFSRPSQLFLDFGVINPYILQSLNNSNSPLVINPSSPFQAGIIKSAYRPDYLKPTDIQLAITTDNLAYRGLVKSVLGLNTGAMDTGVLNEYDNLKIGLLAQLLDYLAQDTTRFEKLKTLINNI